MKQIIYLNKIWLVGFLLWGLASCSKDYGYDFENGYATPQPNDSIDLNIDTSRHIDRSKYGAARLFPGLVGDSAPRLQNFKVNLNIDYKTADKSLLRISVLPEPWFGTGLYAPAGERIKIEVPAGVYGLTAQIGVWTDNLSGKTELMRDPLIVNKKALFPGENYIRNLYGGPLIIIASRSVGRTIALEVSGAVKSPDFILGETTDAEWKSMIRHTTVPWFALRGEHIVFNLPVSKLHSYPLNNPTELMKAWDSVIVNDYNKWYGLSNHPADPRDLAPQLPWRVVQDIQPSVGYAHSGYPVVAKMDDNWFRQITSVYDLRHSSNWGTLHEIGHNFQMGSTWKWSGLGEVSNNLHSFKVAHRYGHKHSKMTSSDFASALAWAAEKDENKEFSDLNVTERLVPFVQIFELYGYDFQTYLTTEARHDQHTAISDQGKIDFYYEKLSEFVGKNMTKWMNQWGLYPSQQAQEQIAPHYPALQKKVWLYNPWTGKGGDGKIFLDRAAWQLLDYDSKASGYPVSNVFDGDKSTFWNTEYRGSKDPYPHWFKVDMTREQLVDGFYFIDRSGNPYHQNPKTVDIYVGNDPNNLNLVVSGEVLPDKSSKLTIDLPNGARSFQYFKIVFTAPWHGKAVMDLAEVGIY